MAEEHVPVNQDGFKVLVSQRQVVDIVLDDLHRVYYLVPVHDEHGADVSFLKTRSYLNHSRCFQGRYADHNSSNYCQENTNYMLHEVRVGGMEHRGRRCRSDEHTIDYTFDVAPPAYDGALGGPQQRDVARIATATKATAAETTATTSATFARMTAWGELAGFSITTAPKYCGLCTQRIHDSVHF